MNNLSNAEISKILSRLSVQNRASFAMTSRHSRDRVQNYRLGYVDKLIKSWKSRVNNSRGIIDRLFEFIIQKRFAQEVFFSSEELWTFFQMQVDDVGNFRDFNIPDNLRFKSNDGTYLTPRHPDLLMIINNNYRYVFSANSVSIYSIENNFNNSRVIFYGSEATSFQDLIKKISKLYLLSQQT